MTNAELYAQAGHAPRPLSGHPLERTASPFGLAVAHILDDIWALYNMRLDSVDFTRDWIVEVNYRYGGLSTFDFDYLTQLVIRCHDAAIRFTVAPSRPGHLKLLFHPRERSGDTTSRHPTIEEAIVRTRSRNYFTRSSVTRPLCARRDVTFPGQRCTQEDGHAGDCRFVEVP